MKDVNTVAESMINSMPVSEPVGQPVSEPVGQPVSDDKDVLTDSGGNIFDSSIHAVDKEGKPLFTAKGLFRKKRQRKKSKIADIPEPDATMAFKACGATTAEMVFIACQGLGGPDWVPRDEERAYMTEAWTQYYQAKDIKDLPPGVIVATAMISYAAPRFTMPETQSRFKKFLTWAKAKVNKLRGHRIQAKTPENKPFKEPEAVPM